jgi:outer membrane lipoprotein-sorting protein
MSRTSQFSFIHSVSLTLGAVLFACTGAWAQAPEINWSLDSAVRQIERQAKDFKTAMARVELVETREDGTEVDRVMGTVFVRADGKTRYNIDGEQYVTFVDRSAVSEYNATAGTVEEYSLRKHKNRLEPFARLGFSATGSDMKRDYLLTVLGEEEIGSHRTIVLELTPQRDGVRETVRLVRLYIDQASWMPVRQVFKSTRDGTTLTMTYTGMARNLALKTELFQNKWPRGTKKIKK